MKLSYQRARDMFLLMVGSMTLLYQFTIAPGPPDSAICVAAFGVMATPAFLRKDGES